MMMKTEAINDLKVEIRPLGLDGSFEMFLNSRLVGLVYKMNRGYELSLFEEDWDVIKIHNTKDGDLKIVREKLEHSYCSRIDCVKKEV